MPAFAWFASAAAFALSMSVTPGPNNAMLTSSGASYGARRTVPHLVGVAVGMPVMIGMLGLCGQALLADPVLHAAMKWAGIAYLLWLAWRIATAVPVVGGPAAGGRPLRAWQAALFQWVNPKAWIAATSGLAAFNLDGSTGPTLWLCAMFLGSGLVSGTIWTAMGVGTGRLLRSVRALRRFNQAMAALLVASLVPALRD